MKNPAKGFTIVELLIVIVVIAILAAISIVAYNGISVRAQNSKISSDLSLLSRTITIAQTNSGKTLKQMTYNGWTAGDCIGKPTGIDLAALPRSDTCWLNYASFLNAVSNESGSNIRNLVDPYGRPYFVDENEGDSSPTSCAKDELGTYSRPFVQNSYTPGNSRLVPNSLPNC